MNSGAREASGWAYEHTHDVIPLRLFENDRLHEEGRVRMTERVSILETQNLTKHYGSVVALENVSITLNRGEIVGLLGDNGAGKSTLVKCISGALKPTSGRIYLNGELQDFSSPGDARAAGIETVYQQLALVDIFDMTDNLFLGKELTYRDWRRWIGILDRRGMREQAHAALSRIPARFPDLDAPIKTMSGGQRQVVAMARGAFWEGRLLLLDEPTAALGVRESESVIAMIKALITERAEAMVVISHNMEHVWSVCDRILILRRGTLVADLQKADTDRSEVVSYIVGAT